MRGNVDSSAFSRRLIRAAIFIYIVICIVAVRLWFLQCLRGAYFRDLSENNRKRTVRAIAPRGDIYDREGRILVRNRPSFNVALMLEDVPDKSDTIAKIASYTGRSVEELTKRLEHRTTRPFEPLVVLPDVSREELARIRVHTYDLPGVIVDVLPARDYVHGNLAVQLFGYAREINKTQLDALNSSTVGRVYAPGDIIGQSGLEKVWEPQLGGENGAVLVEVDAHGNRKRELGIQDPRPGMDLHTTIDLDLQTIAEQALDNRRGAVVALDPNSGEVLVLASSPTYDANILSGALDAGDWKTISESRDKPLMNRALASTYAPGSTIKLAYTAAALAEKKLTENTELNCPGYYMFAGRPYHCHKHSGHGVVNLRKAVTMSCNVFFYQVGQMLGIDLINKYLTMFGFGQKTGIDLLGEESGTAPSESWKKKVFGEKWYPGDTLPVSIGQGYLIATPVQLAQMASIVANGGVVYRPFVVKQIVDPNTGEESSFESHEVRQLPINKEVFEKVRSFASDVVNTEQGTGKKAALPGIIVGGKTGTAQVRALGTGTGHGEDQDHAWFVCFAPADKPMIAMAVLVENAGHGGVAAAPIAHEVLQAFFRKKGMLPPEEVPDGAKPEETTTTAPPVTQAQAQHGIPTT